MTQWKDKAGKNREGASVGLFTYPVLQAADVLLYRRRTCRSARTRSSISSWRATSRPSSTPISASTCSPLPEPLISHGRAADHVACATARAKMSKSDPSDMRADQPDRRRRHDRAEVPQGEDRSPSRCPTTFDELADRPEAQQPGDDLRRARRRERRCGARAIRRQGLRRVQARARRSGGRDARPDPRPADRGCSTTARAVGAILARGRRQGARRSPRPTLLAAQHAMGLQV